MWFTVVLKKGLVTDIVAMKLVELEIEGHETFNGLDGRARPDALRHYGTLHIIRCGDGHQIFYDKLCYQELLPLRLRNKKRYWFNSTRCWKIHSTWVVCFRHLWPGIHAARNYGVQLGLSLADTLVVRRSFSIIFGQ